MKISLLALQTALAKRKNVSARTLAELVDCSLPTVYRRLQLLIEAGAIITEARTPGSKTGPVPRLFTLTRAAR